jgi:serine/threonine protein phosphatase PrpC
MKPTVRLRYAAKTDVGMKRAHNEDYFSLIEDEVPGR